MNKIVLFDADGVLTLPEEVFSVVYTRSHGLDPVPIENFFKTQWRDFVLGKRDLKRAIAENPEVWQWRGDPADLLDLWFKSEDVRNEELLGLIGVLRERGVECYLATEQEKYRAEYMKSVMFKDMLDGFFVTVDIGYTKGQPEFFQSILRQLQLKNPGLMPSDVVFFDDSQSKIDAAVSIGIDARLYSGVEQVRSLLFS